MISNSQISPKNKLINQIKKNQKLEFKRLANWVIAGSGNFEKTQTDGRYRDNCNTFRKFFFGGDHITTNRTNYFSLKTKDQFLF